jgi:hypothetical protein
MRDLFDEDPKMEAHDEYGQQDSDESIHKHAEDRMAKIMAKPIQKNLDGNTFSVDNSNYWEIKDIPTRYKLYPEGTRIEARLLKVIEQLKAKVAALEGI